MTQTPAADIVERLRTVAERQRTKRGDLLTYGQPDPWLEQAATEIEALRAANMDLQLHFDVLRDDHAATQRKLYKAEKALEHCASMMLEGLASIRGETD